MATTWLCWAGPARRRRGPTVGRRRPLPSSTGEPGAVPLVPDGAVPSVPDGGPPAAAAKLDGRARLGAVGPRRWAAGGRREAGRVGADRAGHLAADVAPRVVAEAPSHAAVDVVGRSPGVVEAAVPRLRAARLDVATDQPRLCRRRRLRRQLRPLPVSNSRHPNSAHIHTPRSEKRYATVFLAAVTVYTFHVIAVMLALLLLLLLLHPFNGLFSRTTWVIRYQKGKNQSGFK